MIQRDLKIGLVLGLVLVVGAVIKLATDPRLSTETRMAQLNSAEIMDNADANTVSRNYLSSEIPLDSEQPGLSSKDQPADVLVAQNDNSQQLFTSSEPGQQSNIDTIEQKEIAQNQEVLPETSIPSNIAEDHISSSQKAPTEPAANLSQVQEQLILPAALNYDKAEIIKAEKFHIVKKNQTLSDISRIYYGSAKQWQKIVAGNPDLIKDPNKIKAGMKIIIP